MLLIVAVAISSGLVTFTALSPFSLLAALITAPIVASTMAVLAGLLLSWREASKTAFLDLDAQTDAMVTALRSVAQPVEAPPSDLRTSNRRDRAA